MRLYTFVNMYLARIQFGIQSLHVLGNLNTKYGHREDENLIKLRDWQANHQTVIVLKGGYSSELRNIFRRLEVINQCSNIPFAKFHESDDALDGALTAVGVVVDTKVIEYNDTRNKLRGEWKSQGDLLVHPDLLAFELSEDQLDLANLISSYPLA